MTFESSLAFILAFSVVVAIPGPGVMAVVSEAMAKGARQGWFTVCGIIVGDFIYLSFAMFGLGVGGSDNWRSICNHKSYCKHIFDLSRYKALALYGKIFF